MKKILHYDTADAGRLHCDACGYDLPGKLAFTERLIGFECPECGANMLTRRDYDATVKLFRVVDIINKIGRIIGLGTERPPAKAVSLGVKMHDGAVEITPRKP